MYKPHPCLRLGSPPHTYWFCWFQVVFYYLTKSLHRLSLDMHGCKQQLGWRAKAYNPEVVIVVRNWNPLISCVHIFLRHSHLVHQGWETFFSRGHKLGHFRPLLSGHYVLATVSRLFLLFPTMSYLWHS